MDTEDSTNVLSVGSGFLSETRGDSGVSQREGRLFYPLVLVVGTEGLFRGGNKVFFLAFTVRVVRLSRDLVQLFVEVVELSDGGHDVLVHEKRGLDDVVSPCAQKGNTVIDNRLVQQDTGIRQKVRTVTGNIRSAGGFVATDSPQEFVVGQRFGFRQGVLDFSLGSRQDVRSLGWNWFQAYNQVVFVFVVGDRDLWVDEVSNAIEELVAAFGHHGKICLDLLDLLLDGFHLCDLCGAILLGLFLWRNFLLLDLVHLLSQFVLFLGQGAPFLVLRNDLVHPFGGFEPLFHVFAVLGGISPLVCSELVDVDRHFVLSVKSFSFE
mmetsp:Transcript_9203/g.19312  ORF Transcript_9203/g.19312 Transcript_9203/m.19312 type:complete len:322 (-) Transcript_9203:44-1009(-)